MRTAGPTYDDNFQNIRLKRNLLRSEGDQWFESALLQRGVSCEPEADRKQPGSDGDRHGHRHQPRHHNAPDNAFIRPPPRSPRSPAIVPAVGCVWVTRFARSGRRNVNPLDSSSRRFRPRTAFPPIARSGISASPTRRRPPPTAPRAATRARLDQCRLGRAVLARHRQLRRPAGDRRALRTADPAGRELTAPCRSALAAHVYPTL
jgi:hypothetical protein